MSAPPLPKPQAPTRRAHVTRAGTRLLDRGAHVVFAAAALLTVAVIVTTTVLVLREAWPSFSYNGLSWLGNADTSLDAQLDQSFQGTRGDRNVPYRELHAFPALLGTFLTTGGALLLAVPFATLAAVFIAELAPRPVAAVLEPVVRLMAGVPSVIWGLFAILLLAPFLSDTLIDPAVAEDYAPVVTLTGANVLLGVLVLAIMIAPIMIAIFTDALRGVPNGWREGSYALGCDRWRAVRRVTLPAVRPALVSGAALATGRALGEAIALSLATGGISFIPNPLDGLYFFLEPVRPLAAVIVEYQEGFSQPELRADLFAFGAVLFVSTAALTIGTRIASIPFERKLGRRA